MKILTLCMAGALGYTLIRMNGFKKALLQTIDSTELLANAIIVQDELVKTIINHSDDDELIAEIEKILEKFQFNSIVEEWFKPSDEI